MKTRILEPVIPAWEQERDRRHRAALEFAHQRIAERERLANWRFGVGFIAFAIFVFVTAWLGGGR